MVPDKGGKCRPCAKARLSIMRRKYELSRSNAAKRSSYRQQKNLRQQHRRLKMRLSSLKEKLLAMTKQCKGMKETTFEESLEGMRQKQREAALHFFRDSKRKSTRGMGFTQNWILECLLMKMKSPKLYNYMRQNKILVLPSEDTLRKYLYSYKTGFGFCTRVLRALKEQTRGMDSFKRHGGLLVDELKLSEHLSVISAATFEGLVDLGRFTPKSEKCEPCDHGMVIMFAPFTGKWTQILAVFATHGNVKGELLAKLLVEAVLLAEDAGLLVDFVTCEGATWNRKMWKVLGIGATSASIKCRMRHPKDGSHYLHFLSDFPQLVKCLRNNLLSHNFDTPDGLVSLDIVKNVYDMDGSAVTLRLMHGIREAHLNPNNFEKMRITMIHSIITIMSSRHPRSALRMNSTAADCLTAFLAYVTEWEVLTKGTRGFMSQSTATGLRVTIKSTLLPLEYLTVKMGYQYLMTSRLNQDPLESTFGIVRQCSGNNDHPTPQLFLDTMSCLSFSNLGRLPDKGNVGPNTVQSLLSPKMCRRFSSQKPRLAHELANVPFIGNEEELNNFSNEDDHAAYISARSDRRLVHYMGGYVARKCVLTLKCTACESHLLVSQEDAGSTTAELTLQCDYGGLLYPSSSLFDFIAFLEDTFTECFSARRVHYDSISDMVEILKAKKVKLLDRASINTARATQDFLDDEAVMQLQGPSRSPDLDIIEDVEEHEVMSALYNSLPERIDAVKSAHGGSTRY
ncbi:hypothetical protein HPB49_007028 [Dermacentor silvarum]|uniref:Uncharacterized protein n=1 Tax=Dermacentor silvarum TaxID=543639 RepID=A0ACB8CVS1_DERSI|nr:hypothetical protein HPB49_007028 [Dermacentor silvarum]